MILMLLLSLGLSVAKAGSTASCDKMLLNSRPEQSILRLPQGRGGGILLLELVNDGNGAHLDLRLYRGAKHGCVQVWSTLVSHILDVDPGPRGGKALIEPVIVDGTPNGEFDVVLRRMGKRFEDVLRIRLRMHLKERLLETVRYERSFEKLAARSAPVRSCAVNLFNLSYSTHGRGDFGKLTSPQYSQLTKLRLSAFKQLAAWGICPNLTKKLLNTNP